MLQGMLLYFATGYFYMLFVEYGSLYYWLNSQVVTSSKPKVAFLTKHSLVSFD